MLALDAPRSCHGVLLVFISCQRRLKRAGEFDILEEGEAKMQKSVPIVFLPQSAADLCKEVKKLQGVTMKLSFAEMTVREISEFLKTAEDLAACLDELESDRRAAVRKLAMRIKRDMEEKDKRNRQVRKLYRYQQWLMTKCHVPMVIGVDEVGRGPLAGPVVAAAVGLPLEPKIVGLDDSKKLSDAQRRRLAEIIYRQAVYIGIGQASAAEIDAMDIRQASLLAMLRAVEMCKVPTDALVVVDGKDEIPSLDLHQRSVVKGDARVAAVAAASIVAKVYRDNLMLELDKKYPQYGFAAHKGYPTPAHLDALRRYGLSPEHRRSFCPCIDLRKSANI